MGKTQAAIDDQNAPKQKNNVPKVKERRTFPKKLKLLCNQTRILGVLIVETNSFGRAAPQVGKRKELTQ